MAHCFYLQALYVLVESEGDIAAFSDYVPAEATAASAPASPASEPVAPPQPAPAKPLPVTPIPPRPTPTLTPVPPPAPPAAPAGGRIFASPLAKRLAAERGINLSVSGLGFQGR